jgi:hypothetical protein
LTRVISIFPPTAAAPLSLSSAAVALSPTWVLVFQSRPGLPHNGCAAIQPVAIAGVIVLLAVGGEQNFR